MSNQFFFGIGKYLSYPHLFMHLSVKFDTMVVHEPSKDIACESKLNKS